VVRRWVLSGNNGAGAAQEGSAWRSVGSLGLWGLRLIFDVPGTLAGFRRWILAVAPIAPGLRAETRPAAGDLRALVASSNGRRAGGTTDQPAERHATRAGAQHESPGQAGHPARNEPARNEPRGEKKREALIRLCKRCGETGDPGTATGLRQPNSLVRSPTGSAITPAPRVANSLST
jgi:hypothetical protein